MRDRLPKSFGVKGCRTGFSAEVLQGPASALLTASQPFQAHLLAVGASVVTTAVMGQRLCPGWRRGGGALKPACGVGFPSLCRYVFRKSFLFLIVCFVPQVVNFLNPEIVLYRVTTRIHRMAVA